MTATIATVWAHYDDDLLFANPTIADALAGGDHVRSLFLTASDAGKGMTDYAREREVGIRAAYDVMLGGPHRWVDRPRTFANGVTVTVTAPEHDDRAALAFLRLPDGGLTGNGYYPTGYETLPRLLRGVIPTIRALDSGQELTVDLLVAIIAAFVTDAGASAVIANLPGSAADADGDHPDHRSAGDLVAAVVAAGLVDGGIVRYAVGYPGGRLRANVSGESLARKLAAFAAYGAHDAVLTRPQPEDYLALPGFGASIPREYLVTDREARHRPGG